MEIAIFIYWGGILFIFLVTLGYPLLLLCLPRSKNKTTLNGTYRPLVSIITPVHNAEGDIEGKIGNLLVQSYPRDKIEIIVASDASSDKTDILVKKYDMTIGDLDIEGI